MSICNDSALSSADENICTASGKRSTLSAITKCFNVNFIKKLLGKPEKPTKGGSPDKFGSTKNFKKDLADAIFAFLKDKDFKRRGMNFSLSRNDVVYFIQVQSSQFSTAAVWKLTVNAGIASLILSKMSNIVQPTYLDSHWKKRIGLYLNSPVDKWWMVSDQTSLQVAKKEIVEVLENYVLPDIFSFQDTADLQQFWLQGNYQGLTNRQRDNYIKLLE